MGSPDEILVLRTCNPDRTSRNGFIWPESGWVEAPDWDSSPVCGRGLHGLPWGEGDGVLLDWSPEAVWLVVAVPLTPVVDLDGKIKFPRGRVVYCGTREGATQYIYRRASGSPAIAGVTLTGGDESTLTGGYKSTLTGGYKSTLTGGDESTLTGGDGSTLTGGAFSTLTGGKYPTLTGGAFSTLTGGYKSTLTGGDESTLTGGKYSTLTGGAFSTLTGGYKSTLTGGYKSTLTGGAFSTLTGGDGSTLLFSYYDKEQSRYRRKLFEVGVDAEPGVAYRLNGDGELQAVEVSDGRD